MSARFNVLPVLRGHWKGLTDGRRAIHRGDKVARSSIGIPLAVFLLMYLRDGKLASPAPLLTGVSLLAGGMLSAFTHLSSLRLRITDWDGAGGISRFEVERRMLDETAAHLLTGSLLCAIDAGSLVVGMNISLSKSGHLYGFWAALSTALSSYILVIFIFVIPRLYSAYVEINGVGGELSGFTKKKRRR
ncbi:hypothetical protein AB0399_39290 [Streptomyces sp. NPDC088194]|uniref:hypothetical protein n=1 Tax=Streptomyces sp. NPDC088194 TaxID=3154931 RepID=UPI0034504CA4